jgi:hypothetical protein
MPNLYGPQVQPEEQGFLLSTPGGMGWTISMEVLESMVAL